MEERRRLERFSLSTPARIQIESYGVRQEKFDLVTRDVSSAGAFLYSTQQIPEGANVRTEFYITLDTLGKTLGEEGKAKVRVKGKVVRVDPDGIAIRFDSRFRITALADNNR